MPFVCLCAMLPAASLMAQSTSSSQTAGSQTASSQAAPTQVASAAPAKGVAGSTVAPTTAAASIADTDGGPAEAATYIKGFNATLTSASQHESGEGWSNSLTPDVSYSLNSHLGGDFSVPYYTYTPYDQFTGTLLHPTTTRIIVHNVIGDAAGTVHFAVSPSFMDYVFTVAGGFPVGNDTYGLSAEQYTYNINNHFDKSIGIFLPEVEIGFGDSNSLTKHRVLRTSSIVGNLAFFTAGTGVDLPWNLSFSADAYEQMPLQSLTTYKTLRAPKRKILYKVETGTSPAADNGIETSLDIPLNPHVTLSGIYDRSLRNHEDTAGFSLTFVLRVPKPKPAATAASH